MSTPDEMTELPFPVSEKRRPAIESRLSVLTEIHHQEINIAIWQRDLSKEILLAAGLVLDLKPNLQFLVSVTPNRTHEVLSEILGTEANFKPLITDAVGLVDIFCHLFCLERVGLRLMVLSHVMCPRFHVDNVSCRLLTTYQGAGTEWLDHNSVDRSKLGPRSAGTSDEESGLFPNFNAINELREGEVALLKGEAWAGNEGAGLVHRSPCLKSGKSRLLLSLDFDGAEESNFSCTLNH